MNLGQLFVTHILQSLAGNDLLHGLTKEFNQQFHSFFLQGNHLPMNLTAYILTWLTIYVKQRSIGIFPVFPGGKPVGAAIHNYYFCPQARK